ncbi:MAG TPA: hypothetical protein VFK24_07355 [Gammaproteobacteria bacterium]|nr:hypothetical protein [Gammaproteobacteria bacterium]
MKCLRFTLLLAPLVLAAPALAAQPVSPKLYAGMHWRLIGPFRGGRALAAAGIPGKPNVYYFGSVAGGVWKTTDAGGTWQAMFQHGGTSSIGALAIAPSNPNIIYIGTGEADMRSDVTFGDGVYKTTDGGKTWHHLGLTKTRHIGRILIDPHNPDIVLVAALGHIYGPNTERGVYRTTDGGKTWHKVLYKNARTGAVDLAWDPANPRVVYAALWQVKRVPWTQYGPVSGSGSGLYKSTDEGRTWTEIEGHGFPAGSLGRIGIGVSRNDHGQRVYALVQAKDDSHSGLYRSDDAGRTWKRVSANNQITTRMWYFGRVTVDPADPNTVFLPNRSVFRSTDGGHTFKAIKGEPGGDDYHFLWINPNHPEDMIVASDQGTVVTLNNGDTWSSWYNQPTAQFYHVATDNQFPYRIYGAQQDSGSVSIASRSPDGQISFRDWHATAGGESGYVLPKPGDPNIVYGDGYGGRVERVAMPTRDSQDISPWPVSTWGAPPPKRKFRSTWTPAMAVNPAEPNALYFGTQYVLETSDGGLNWQQLSGDLTGADAHASTHGALTLANARERGYGVVYAIAPSTVDPKLIWAGSDDGLLWLTRDGGKHWRNVTPPGVDGWSKMAIVEASPFDAGTAYVAVDRHRVDDLHPYIYRTRDYGRTWTEITAGIKAPAFVRVVRADPKRPGLLYAGTELGIYVSFDDGDNWQSLQINLPTTPIRDLAIRDGDLIAATHGRGFWVLDDLSPLRQVKAGMADAPATLYRPAIAIRMRPGSFGGTPLPPETPTGENPPTGAIIDYYLKQGSGPVELTIFDDDGNLVRRFASNAKLPKIDYADIYFEHTWLKPPERLSAKAGMHRFVWDLRRDPPPAIHVSRYARGPLVLPGNYVVQLTVNGHNYTQPLTVKLDPRVQVPRSALTRQVKLEKQIEDEMARSRDAYTRVHALRERLNTLKTHIKSPELQQSVGTLAANAKDLAEGGGYNVHGFSDINRDLQSLLGKVDDAPRQPPQQYYALLQVLSERLDDTLSRWKRVRNGTLDRLNKELKGRKMAPIRIQ